MIVDSVVIGNPKILEVIKELGRKAPQPRKKAAEDKFVISIFWKIAATAVEEL